MKMTQLTKLEKKETEKDEGAKENNATPKLVVAHNNDYTSTFTKNARIKVMYE
jgi:hypothetical protein